MFGKTLTSAIALSIALSATTAYTDAAAAGEGKVTFNDTPQIKVYDPDAPVRETPSQPAQGTSRAAAKGKGKAPVFGSTKPRAGSASPSQPVQGTSRAASKGKGKAPVFGSTKPRAGSSSPSNPTFGSTKPRTSDPGGAKSASRTLAKNAPDGDDLKKAGKVAKKGKKLRKVGKFVAGGAAVVVAETALGVQTPDIFDAAEFTVDVFKDPANADKKFAGLATGGTDMAFTALDAATDPRQMANNLKNAGEGVGRSIANTGVYKSAAKTKTGRAIGKAATWTHGKLSNEYNKFARSRTGKAVGKAYGAVEDKVFKPMNKAVEFAGKHAKKWSARRPRPPARPCAIRSRTASRAPKRPRPTSARVPKRPGRTPRSGPTRRRPALPRPASWRQSKLPRRPRRSAPRSAR